MHSTVKVKLKKIVDAVDPICNNINIDGKIIYYWTKPLLHAISFSLSNYLSSLTADPIDLFDFVMGGDHGQQKF